MISRTLKHYVKRALGRPDPSWPLHQFERGVHPQTWARRHTILVAAEHSLAEKETREAPTRYAESADPIVRQGYALKQKTEQHFKNLFADDHGVRILIHVPDPMRSPAGYSLFTNFAEAFRFIGIPARTFSWSDPTEQILNDFKPTILLLSDHRTWLEKINWDAVRMYRQQHPLRVGLTASLAEYGNTPLAERLQWAKDHAIDFFYSFRDSDYVRTRKEYQPFFDAGYKVLFLPFGVNIAHYYPVPDLARDIPYAFLASVNGSKATRYAEYMLPVVAQHQGLIDGPGWQKIRDFRFNRDRDRYVYARAQVGLNLHLQEQVDWACEVNERTFMLAACGVPQVVDNAKLLQKLFSKDALFVAKSPREYREYVEMILRHPSIGAKRALVAQNEAFENHTTFHRAQAFIDQLRANHFMNE